MEKTKKTLLILIVIVLVVVLALGILYYNTKVKNNGVEYIPNNDEAVVENSGNEGQTVVANTEESTGDSQVSVGSEGQAKTSEVASESVPSPETAVSGETETPAQENATQDETSVASTEGNAGSTDNNIVPPVDEKKLQSVNVSSNIQAEKQYDGYKITITKMATTEEGKTFIEANVINSTKSDKPETYIKIVFLDSNGAEVDYVPCYIKASKAGEKIVVQTEMFLESKDRTDCRIEKMVFDS